MAKTKKPHPYPNKETQWSYFMQAIEPTSREINEAFPGFHPMWVIQSQSKAVTADNFKFIREALLSMSIEQCAAYLRVSVHQVQQWETDKQPIPFMAFELLRVVYESVQFRLSNKDWKGWFINQAGRLVSPDRGKLSFSPDELSFIRETHQVKAMFERENQQLRAEIQPLRDEIKELRAASGGNGLLDELKAIEARLADLTKQVSNSKVVPISSRGKSTKPPLQEKVA